MIKEYLYPPDEPTKALEDDHLINFTTWFNHWYPDVYWFHVPNENGGKAGKQYFLRQQAKGLRKGVADIVILHRGRNGEPFGVIEMKRENKRLSTPVSKEQVECLSAVSAQGGFAAVAYGFHCAKLAVIDFLGPSTILVK